MTWRQLVICNLSLGYAGKCIRRNLDMEFDRGNAYVLVGRNGVGKTTLLRTLAGLLPALEGSVRPKLSLDDWGMAVPSAVLLQEDFGLFPSLTSLDVMRRVLLRRRRDINRRSAEIEIELIRERLSISSSVLNRKQGELSGGEGKIVHLAMALLGGAEVILLDEMFSGFDAEKMRRVAEVLVQVAREDRIVIGTDHRVHAAVSSGFLSIPMDTWGSAT
jgi:ABC-type multidrug transport system ATPase subunit